MNAITLSPPSRPFTMEACGHKNSTWFLTVVQAVQNKKMTHAEQLEWVGVTSGTPTQAAREAFTKLSEAEKNRIRAEVVAGEIPQVGSRRSPATVPAALEQLRAMMDGVPSAMTTSHLADVGPSTNGKGKGKGKKAVESDDDVVMRPSELLDGLQMLNKAAEKDDLVVGILGAVFQQNDQHVQRFLTSMEVAAARQEQREIRQENRQEKMIDVLLQLVAPGRGNQTDAGTT